MKIIFTLVLLLHFTFSYSQWTKVQQLPSTDIASLYHKDSILYAGGKNIIYVSKDKGLTWDSTSSIPKLFLVTSIIVYKNELYAAAPNKGVFKSPDGGITWQEISTGLFPDVSDFCEFGGDLYAATLGNSIYILDRFNHSRWLPFSNGLSNLSLNLTAIEGNSNALIASTIANGLYDYLPANSLSWEERFLLPQVSVNEGAFDIITAHDTLFFAGRTGRYYMSTDNGLTWSLFGNRLVTAATSIVNAKQALLSSTHFLNAGSFMTAFFYIKKDSLQDPFVNFSIVADHFTYKIDIIGDKLWDASNKGLFYMSLSDLPGISSADDSSVTTTLPIRFALFNVKCEGDNKLITWKTAQEQNSSHFNIERSDNGINWTTIGMLTAANNSAVESSYSFTDKNPLADGYYRIAGYDLDGKVKYSSVMRSSCTISEGFTVFPNPVIDKVFINIVASNDSKATIQLFDGKGALVKLQNRTVRQGNNHLDIDMKYLTRGLYHLSVSWNNGLMQKAVQIVKQ